MTFFEMFLSYVNANYGLSEEEIKKALTDRLRNENYELKRRVFKAFASFIEDALNEKRRLLCTGNSCIVQKYTARPFIDEDDLEETFISVFAIINGVEVKIFSVYYEWLTIINEDEIGERDISRVFNEKVLEILDTTGRLAEAIGSLKRAICK